MARGGSNSTSSGSPRMAANACLPHCGSPTVIGGSSSSPNQPTSLVSNGWAFSSPPIASQRKTVEYSGIRVMPMRMPSRTAMTPFGTHSMPVSSRTSFDRDLRRRVADVGPTGGVQPDPGVGPLHEQDATLVVVDDGADGRLRGDVAGHPLADAAHPLVDVVLDVELGVGGDRRADVAGHVEHLLEALALVEALGEAEPGAGDGSQRLRPADQVLAGRGSRRSGSSDGVISGWPGPTRSPVARRPPTPARTRRTARRRDPGPAAA